MNKETRAVLIIFDGTELPATAIDTIANHIANIANTEKVDTFTYSAKEIAAAIMSNVGKIEVASVEQKREERTPEDQAIIFIGTIMKDALEAPFDGYVLFKALVNKIDELRNGLITTAGKEAYDQFMNALFILSQENLVISKSLMKKYHFSQEKIATIKKTYNFVTKF